MLIGNTNLASLVLRIGMGSYMALGHGAGKFQTLISGAEIHFPSLLGMPPVVGLALAVLAEFIACILIIIGYKTRYVAILPIIVMAYAAFIIHSSDPWFAKGAEGASKEMAMIYLIGFVAIYLLGSGKYSLDSRLNRIL